jgi:hypothetical protein
MSAGDALLAAGLVALLHHAFALASRHDRPVAQALARIVTLLPAYLHELAHAAVSVALTGRGRIRLHSVRQHDDGAARADGQVAIGSSDIFYFGPRSNALVSAAPALLLWPAAAALLWHGGSAWAACGASLLAYAGRLSDTDRAHLRAALLQRG